jgi:hypothetical protein
MKDSVQNESRVYNYFLSDTNTEVRLIVTSEYIFYPNTRLRNFERNKNLSYN